MLFAKTLTDKITKKKMEILLSLFKIMYEYVYRNVRSLYVSICSLLLEIFVKLLMSNSILNRIYRLLIAKIEAYNIIRVNIN